MEHSIEDLLLAAFRQSFSRVPAYRQLLQEAEIIGAEIKTMEDFFRLPICEKFSTFRRFDIQDLCLDGEIGHLASVLTSSGHSGIFAFGLNNAVPRYGATEWIDNLLDYLFEVKSKKTLLINCLPMGVKVPTEACTLAETSVRADMVVGLVKALGGHYAQIILVGEAAFVKHVLELGAANGVDWFPLLVHIVLGEEPLAENARKYLEKLLGTAISKPDKGVIASSMGVAEVGLNLFFEVPPAMHLILLRRLLHENAKLRSLVLGHRLFVPCLFTYDPRRIYVEFDAKGRLLLTTLESHLRVPLVRYATGDSGRLLDLPPESREEIEAAGIKWDLLLAIPIVIIEGRGDYASAGDARVYPEAVKEGIYKDPDLASLSTANFRLVSDNEKVRVRIQLSPGIVRDTLIEERFLRAIQVYVDAPIEVVCEAYETFGSGMTLDFERKFNYLGR